MSSPGECRDNYELHKYSYTNQLLTNNYLSDRHCYNRKTEYYSIPITFCYCESFLNIIYRYGDTINFLLNLSWRYNIVYTAQISLKKYVIAKDIAKYIKN